MMARPNSSLKGKVAVVTGATRGVGLIIAACFAQAGAQIAICGRTMEAAESIYAQFSSIPMVEILALPADVRDPVQLAMLAEQTIARFGKIDIWVNNAAISGPYAPLGDLPAAAWRDIVDTNLTGTFNGMQIALRHMLARGEGKIINIMGSERQPRHLAAYETTKAALWQLTRLTAEEYQHTTLSIVGIAPHFVDTALWREPALTDAAEESRTQWQDLLDKQATDVIEVGELAVRLAGRETDGVTGKLYPIRGSLFGGWLGK